MTTGRPFRQAQTVCHLGHADKGESEAVDFFDPDVLM